MSSPETIAIVETGTTNAIVETGTLNAIEVTQILGGVDIAGTTHGIADLRGITDRKKKTRLRFTLHASGRFMRPQIFSVLGKMARKSKTEVVAKIVSHGKRLSATAPGIIESRIKAKSPFEATNVRMPSSGLPSYIFEEEMKKQLAKKKRSEKIRQLKEMYKKYKEEFDE